MTYLFAALAIFWAIRLVQTWVDAPSWVWLLVQPALATILLLPWEQEKWYAPLVVAGIVSFMQMLENLLIAKSDEALSAIMRRR
jgi:hypothetical protein